MTKIKREFLYENDEKEKNIYDYFIRDEKWILAMH